MHALNFIFFEIFDMGLCSKGWQFVLVCRVNIVRLYIPKAIIVMDVYFILIKLCYFILMSIYMNYVCI